MKIWLAARLRKWADRLHFAGGICSNCGLTPGESKAILEREVRQWVEKRKAA